MALTAPERETIINMDDESEHAVIWTAQRRVITQLRKNPAFELTAEGEHDGSPWASFRIRAEDLRISAKAKRRPLTDAQREAAAARLRSKTR